MKYVSIISLFECSRSQCTEYTATDTQLPLITIKLIYFLVLLFPHSHNTYLHLTYRIVHDKTSYKLEFAHCLLLHWEEWNEVWQLTTYLLFVFWCYSKSQCHCEFQVTPSLSCHPSLGSTVSYCRGIQAICYFWTQKGMIKIFLVL